MARRRGNPFRTSRLNWREAARWLAAALCALLGWLLSAGASAQQTSVAVVAAGTPPSPASPARAGAQSDAHAGEDPAAKTSSISIGPSLRIVDLRRMGGPPEAQLVGAPKIFTVKAARIGQVFGVAFDDANPPNVYAAASSAYGLPIVAPKNGEKAASFISASAPPAPRSCRACGGLTGGPAAIWRIDGATGCEVGLLFVWSRATTEPIPARRSAVSPSTPQAKCFSSPIARPGSSIAFPPDRRRRRKLRSRRDRTRRARPGAGALERATAAGRHQSRLRQRRAGRHGPSPRRLAPDFGLATIIAGFITPWRTACRSGRSASSRTEPWATPR